MLHSIANANAPSTPNGNLQWYVVQTRPRQEERAEANLAAWGVETLLPKIRARARGVRSIAPPGWEPLFPSYMFVRFDVPTMAAKIRYTRGVAKILGVPEGPSSVDESIIAELRSRVGSDGYVALVPSLTAGDRVRITGGVLRDFVAVFEASTHASHRVHLLLSAVHSQIRVAIEDRFVEKIAAAC